MNVHTRNAIAYFEAHKAIAAELWNTDGTKRFDIHGGNDEIVRVINLIEAHRGKFPRSKCWASAITVWVGLINETANDSGSLTALDWAILQGSIYAGWELPNVPASYFS